MFMIFVCMLLVCAIEMLLLLFLFSSFFLLLLLYFTSLYFTFAVVVVAATAVVALYIIRDDDANEQLFFALYPLSLFFYFCSFMCVRACLCAHGCAMPFLHLGWGFSPHLFRLTLVSTQYYLILSLFAEIVSLSFFCLTLTLPSLHSVPSMRPIPFVSLPLSFSLRYIQTHTHTHTLTQNGARECLCLLLLLIICVMIAYIVRVCARFFSVRSFFSLFYF